MRRVLMVGSAENSGGGVAAVIRLMKSMPVWTERRCGWLGTQVQERSKLVKLGYALRAYLMAALTVWQYGIVHFHAVPDRRGLLVQLPVLLIAITTRRKVIMHIHMGNQLAGHTRNRLFIWCLNRADRIVLLARKWQDMFGELFPTVKTPTAVVYNACGPARFVGMGERGKSVIFAGYIDDNKRADLLLQAWSRIRPERPDWRVTIMGAGAIDRCRATARDLGLDDAVTFTGYITGDRKEAIWNDASIYCMCSHNEGFPMVVLESWARGIAVVTTPVGGLPDVIEEGKNCLTFPFGDAEALAERLLRLTGDAALRASLAEYAHDNTIGRFSPATVNEDWRRLYAELK